MNFRLFPQSSRISSGWGRVAVLLVAGVTLAGAQSATSAWPALAGRLGPYGGVNTAADAATLAHDGLFLTLPSNISLVERKALGQQGITWIDATPWNLINQACKKQYAEQAKLKQARACTLSAADQAGVLKATEARLNAVAHDDALAAYWILDDYPGGNIQPMLVRIHQLIEQQNQQTHIVRPAICGIGGNLDLKPTVKSRSFEPQHAYFDRAAVNLTPQSCDLVAPYLYASGHNNNVVLADWNLRQLLPYVLQTLQERGFDTSKPLLVPVLHAFGSRLPQGSDAYFTPRAQDIVSQTKAYLAYHPVAFLFFTFAPDADAPVSYSNDPAIRQGIQQSLGVLAKSQWLRPRP